MNKLAFVIPFVSREFSPDWEFHLRLLSDTVASINNQQDKDFKCYIVSGDELTGVELDHQILQVKYPYNRLPLRELSGYENRKDINVSLIETDYDIGKKVQYASQFAKKDGCTHVMKLDADDLVSNKLVSLIKSKNKSDNFFIQKGYVMGYGKNYVLQENILHGINGSTNIVAVEYLPQCDFESRDVRDFELFTHHHYLKQRLKDEHKASVLAIPFRSVIYVKHDIGLSQTVHLFNPYTVRGLAKLLLRGRRISRSLRKEFAIPIGKES